MKTKIELVREMIGQDVMTVEPGRKLVRSVAPHGPYKLLKITRGGLALLENGKSTFSASPCNIVVDGYHNGSNRKSCSFCRISK